VAIFELISPGEREKVPASGVPPEFTDFFRIAVARP
jgi:hypothetical protein